jgi:TorA maturation chaperone TorD
MRSTQATPVDPAQTRAHTSDEGHAISLARAEAEFLERHLLNWVPAAKAKLDQINAPAFALLMSLMVQFLTRMHESG